MDKWKEKTYADNGFSGSLVSITTDDSVSGGFYGKPNPSTGQVELKKSSYYFHYCKKCGLVVIPESQDYCFLCVLTLKKFYKCAMKELKTPFVSSDKTYYGNCPFVKVGWSFVQKMITILLFNAVLNCGSLNKTPKGIVDSEKNILKKHGYSDWQISCLKNG